MLDAQKIGEWVGADKQKKSKQTRYRCRPRRHVAGPVWSCATDRRTRQSFKWATERDGLERYTYSHDVAVIVCLLCECPTHACPVVHLHAPADNTFLGRILGNANFVRS
ncbi:hypothetical protein EVAR_40114_1 [Eumeta japonica]|uniref:Uncharacterized protein n=1 Tax=Eumeta variegata TaxID=151549 RepID=A0A4C1W868_EUMVA|nr:hypothetical protein EVAR_40114_1 [Eumeta japonica]